MQPRDNCRSEPKDYRKCDIARPVTLPVALPVNLKNHHCMWQWQLAAGLLPYNRFIALRLQIFDLSP
jgi:hypothetical protein